MATEAKDATETRGLVRRLKDNVSAASDFNLPAGERWAARGKVGAAAAVATAAVGAGIEGGPSVGGVVGHLLQVPLGDPFVICGLAGAGVASAVTGLSWLDANTDLEARGQDRRRFNVAATLTGVVAVSSLALIGGADLATGVGLPHLATGVSNVVEGVGSVAAGLALVSGTTSVLYGRGKARVAAPKALSE